MNPGEASAPPDQPWTVEEESMPVSFVLVMFVLPAAIIATAIVLARATRERGPLSRKRVA